MKSNNTTDSLTSNLDRGDPGVITKMHTHKYK